MVAMINPLKQLQLEKLQKSIEWSNRQLEKPKKKRIEAVKNLVGYHYADGGSSKRLPTPFIKLAVNILIRSLAARAPRALISTLIQSLKPTAANLELAVNKIPGEIELQDTLRRLVMEALFSFGVAKCGLSVTDYVMGRPYGTPFVDVVTLDDFTIDMSAKHISQIQYIGDCYWLDYDELMESDWFPKKNIVDLKADEYTLIGPAGEDRAQGVSIGDTAKLFKDKIWIQDAWLPAEKLMVTYAIKSKKRLNVVERSKDTPPVYHVLGFDDVPGNLLPLPPVAVWRDLHELANRLFRKLGNQADSEKTVLGFSGGDDESVQDFKKSGDGEGIRYTGAEPKRLTAGGVNPNTLAFYMQCRDLFSYFGGNLDSLGGLSPQAETLGQDKLISEASSSQLRDMAQRVVDFCKKIFRSLAYYEWTDPVRRRQLEKKIPGTDMSVMVQWGRDSRLGAFNMYDFDIDVFSLQDNSPSIKLQKLNLIMQQYIMPLMPMLQQSGRMLDADAILKLVAKHSDFHELDDILPPIDASQESTSPQEPTGMPQNTTRTYERVNRPGATESGKSQILQQALMGGTPQGSEIASINRPTG